MNDMDELLTFLNARLDEREARALAASPGPWRPNAEHDEVLAVDDITVAEGFALSGNQLRATVDHIVDNDPTFVLADIAAKWEIIALHADGGKSQGYADGGEFVVHEHACTECGAFGEFGKPWPCETLFLLATPYDRHEDYQEAWKS